MGTTGLTAQAVGAEGEGGIETSAALGRALLVGAAASALLLLFQWPLRELAFAVLQGSDAVESAARGYYTYRIWAAPATLANYAFLGWFIGRGETRTALGLQVLLNLTNMALDAWLVLGLEWGVEGVAVGTLAAEYVAAAAGTFVALRLGVGRHWSRRVLLERAPLVRTLAVNADISIRSLALLAVFAWFTSEGARHGNVVLASNAVLMQLVTISAYFLDGLAFAAESLVGKAVGAKDRAKLIRASLDTTLWAAAIAAVVSGVYLLLGPELVALFTVDAEVRSTADRYLVWAALAPVAGVLTFQLDGVFIGATRSADMRNAMLLSSAIFAVAWLLLLPWGNHGLWCALYVHYAARTATLSAFLPRLLRTAAPA